MDCDGEKVLCANLVNATVIEHRLNDWELSAQCYRIASAGDADACMELNLTTGICRIWYPLKVNRATYIHEQNHCRGWAHRRTWGGEYRWHPMEELSIEYRHSTGIPAASE